MKTGWLPTLFPRCGYSETKLISPTSTISLASYARPTAHWHITSALRSVVVCRPIGSSSRAGLVVGDCGSFRQGGQHERQNHCLERRASDQAPRYLCGSPARHLSRAKDLSWPIRIIDRLAPSA